MPQTIGERLASTRGMWINLDRAKDRREQFEERTLPYLPLIERLTATDGFDIAADWYAEDYYDATNATVAAQKGSPDQLEKRLRDPPQWSENFSLARAKKGRLRMAIMKSYERLVIEMLKTGAERFLFIEDDALMRPEYLDSPMPPDADDVGMIWYGGMVMNLRSEDVSAAERGQPLRWQYHAPRSPRPGESEVRARFLYSSHAIEMRRDAAEIFLKHIMSWDQPLFCDHATWPAVNKFGAWLAVPQVMHQHYEFSYLRDKPASRTVSTTARSGVRSSGFSRVRPIPPGTRVLYGTTWGTVINEHTDPPSVPRPRGSVEVQFDDGSLKWRTKSRLITEAEYDEGARPRMREAGDLYDRLRFSE